MPTPDLASHCPAPQTLAEFHAGALPDTDLEAVAAHLSGCPACESALSQLERSSVEGGLTDRIRKCLVLPAAAGPAYAPTLAGPEAEPTGWFEGLGGSSGPLLGLLDRDEADAPADDRVVGPYRVLGRLGGGGMGVVFRAEHRELGRPTALKVIRADKLDSAGARPRFRAEAQAVASLEHPNIVRLYDFGEADGQLFFGMELVPGGSLAARLTNGPLTPRAAAKLVRDVARAMAHAHRQNVVHRDLKPANILMAGATPKVADFGLAKWVAADNDTADPDGSSAAAQTTAGQVLGTPAYMSVEQAEGRVDDIGPHSDVWSLGVILYECLTRRLPFEGPDKSAVLELVRECEPVRPSVRMPGISPDLEAICLKCLERDTWCRYPDADSLADDLDRWLTDDPVSARTPTRRETAARWVRKHARRVAVAAAVAVVLGGATAGGARLAGGPSAPRVWAEEGTDETARELVAGVRQATPDRPLELVPAAGKPQWFRWVAGAKQSQASPDDGGIFSLHTQTVCLVELLPEVPTDRYRLSAEVRHDRATHLGEVGLYVARQSHPREPRPVNFLTQLTSNGVRSLGELPIELPKGRKLDPTNGVQLIPRLLAEEGAPPDLDSRLSGSSGNIRVIPRGERSGVWYTLTLTVTPDGVTGTWDGQPLTLTADDIGRSLAGGLERLREHKAHRGDPAVQTLQPTFAPRGGVGLLLWRGSAAFRNVSITPMPGTK